MGWSWHRSNPVLWAGLLLAEVYGLWNLAMLAWLTWDVTPRSRPDPSPGRDVDVYICTYDEPVAVLEATLVGCELITYPHTTWLLDDGARPEIAALAQAWDVRYMTRPDKADAKAGNINHALPLTDGELVLVLDADHVPLPDALDTLVGYFEDPSVALVQTPHDFSNHDSIQHYDLGRHEQSVFFSAICVGKDRHNAAFWCGSCALIRREALLSIGGVATDTIAEDFHTTIKLHRQGWRTHYDERIIAQGRAPHDLAAYLLQRDRWARGNLAVFTTPESPLRALQRFPEGLVTQEVAAIMTHGNNAPDRLAAERALIEPRTLADADHPCSGDMDRSASLADRTPRAGHAVGSRDAADGARRLGALPRTAAQRRGDPLRTVHSRDLCEGLALHLPTWQRELPGDAEGGSGPRWLGGAAPVPTAARLRCAAHGRTGAADS